LAGDAGLEQDRTGPGDPGPGDRAHRRQVCRGPAATGRHPARLNLPEGCSHAHHAGLARQLQRRPPQPDQPDLPLVLRAADRVVGDRAAVGDSGAVRHLAPRLVGGAGDGAGVLLVLAAFAPAGRGSAGRVRPARSAHQLPVLAARRGRGRLDRPVHRTQVRGAQAEFPHRPFLSADRPGLADGQAVSQAGIQAGHMTTLLTVISTLLWWVLYSSMAALVFALIGWS